MRWLMVSRQCDPSHGGIGASVSSAAAAMAAAGFEVHLLTRAAHARSAATTGVTVHAVHPADDEPTFSARVPTLRRIERIRPYRYGSWSLAVADALAALELEPDVIEFVDCQAEGWVSLGSRAVAARFPKVPAVVHAHTGMHVMESLCGEDPRRFGRPLYHRWEREALQAASAVLTTSSRLDAWLPADVRPVRVGMPVAPAPPRDPLGVAPTLLFAGVMQRSKGLLSWTRSLIEVLDRAPDARAVLLGADTPTGPAGGSFVEHALAPVPDSLRARITVRGAVPHARVVAEMEQAAAVVVPSAHETFSFVAAEAVARGVPLVVSEAVGLVEHVPGLPTVRPGDVEELAAAQLAILREPDRASAAAARHRRALRRATDPVRWAERRREFGHRLPRRFPRHHPCGGCTAEAMRRVLDAIEGEERRGISAA